MKLLLLFLGLLAPLAIAADLPSSTFWTGKCVNKTSGGTGHVKLLLFEPQAPDANGARKVSGYISVTGWLVGGGPLEASMAKGDIVFATDHLAPIRWKGSFGLDSIVGTYTIPEHGGLPAQQGEFEVDKVAGAGAGAAIRHGLMMVIESESNGIEATADGKKQFGPQVIFDALHPVGTATSVQVTDLKIDWKEGADKSDPRGILRYTTDLALYWQSPLQNRGITRLRTVHHAELGQMIACDLIETNGTTTGEVKEAAKNAAISIGIAAGSALFKAWLESPGE